MELCLQFIEHEKAEDVVTTLLTGNFHFYYQLSSYQRFS